MLLKDVVEVSECRRKEGKGRKGRMDQRYMIV